MPAEIQFIATLKEVRSKALVSLDKSYRVLLETEENTVMEAGTWPADETVTVTITRNPN